MTALFELFNDDEFIEKFNNANNLTEFYTSLGYASNNSFSKNIRDKIKNRLYMLGLDYQSLNKSFEKQKKMNLCTGCGKLTHNKKFCSQECMIEYYKKQKIDNWKQTGDTGCIPGNNVRNCIRTYIQEKQHNCCAICGINNQWNGKELKFILDHINGNAANNQEDNLRLICPNCDSQLDTFKSKNKNSARNFRKKYTDYYSNLNTSFEA